MITVENLRKSFGRGTNATEVLRDIDLTIPDGKWTAIVGPSGSGKSTLLNCLSGLLKPDDIYQLTSGSLVPYEVTA
ncbi:ABC transporter family protein [Melghiribacillus thermohalophilus]|uniref:ABC transporter family protein n=2 Tax=Melghiribacillus thermohalophilus TaxID=1324956 RepID=A0A4R3NCN2_9BACI|nr:ABC transporter family protein [Melghiribacillus thermohalophilus]